MSSHLLYDQAADEDTPAPLVSDVFRHTHPPKLVSLKQTHGGDKEITHGPLRTTLRMFAAEDNELAQSWTHALNKAAASRRRRTVPSSPNAAARTGGVGEDTPVPTRVNAEGTASTTLSTHNILERRRKAS